MNPKLCKEICEMLVDYADRELPASRSDLVAEHLEKCENCRNNLRAIEKSLGLTKVIWRDALGDMDAVQISAQPRIRKYYWRKYAAVAAAIVLVTIVSFTLRQLTLPETKQPTFAEIERNISDAGNAARLLAATEMLSQSPENQPIIKQQYIYIVKTYPRTNAAIEAKTRIQ